MGTQAPAKRPFCSSCSKPARLCLCARIKTPLIDNSVSVTILQHNQEKNHPLNSTRIAALGLKNLAIAMVSDVHFEAQFFIRLLKPTSETDVIALETKKCFCSSDNHSGKPNSEQILESEEPQKPISERDLRNEEKSDFGKILLFPTEMKTDILASNAQCDFANTAISQQTHHSKPGFDQTEAAPIGDEAPVITARIAKCGFTCSLTHLRIPHNQSQFPDFDKLLSSQIGQDAITNGFVVKRLQKKQLNGSKEYEVCNEFEIVIPPGSALLFPTKKSIGLGSAEFDVKHLVVLDGTWKKAKRMYHENPWLKLLPHLKLDPKIVSLYSEVRHQPRVGCLSTIESTVCALKALGDDHEGLEDLLNVFESMIVDQRRCKDERISKTTPG